MSYSLVQQQTIAVGGTVATGANVFSAATTPGNIVVYSIGGGDVAALVSAATFDGVALSVLKEINTQRLSAIYAMLNVGAATAISVTLSPTPGLSWSIHAAEYSWSGGATSGHTLDTANAVSNSGNSTTPATGNMTPTSGRDALLLAASRIGGNYSSGPTDSFTRLTAPSTREEAAYLSVASTSGAYSTTWTAASGGWAAVLGAILAPGGGGGGGAPAPLVGGKLVGGGILLRGLIK
jgi:hypothetical protein